MKRSGVAWARQGSHRADQPASPDLDSLAKCKPQCRFSVLRSAEATRDHLPTESRHPRGSCSWSIAPRARRRLEGGVCDWFSTRRIHVLRGSRSARIIVRAALLSRRTARRFERGLFGVPRGRICWNPSGTKPMGASSGVLVETPDEATDSAVEQSLEVGCVQRLSIPVRQRTGGENRSMWNGERATAAVTRCGCSRGERSEGFGVSGDSSELAILLAGLDGSKLKTGRTP
jgi:hypothetical protein